MFAYDLVLRSLNPLEETNLLPAPAKEEIFKIMLSEHQVVLSLGSNVSGAPTEGGIVVSLKLFGQILFLYLTDTRYGKQVGGQSPFFWLCCGGHLEIV